MGLLHSAGGSPPASFKGHFLLAAEDLLDTNFYRTAVFMIDHGPSGGMGIILNRPTQAPLSVIIPSLNGYTAGRLPLFWGGPVQTERLFILKEVRPTMTQNDQQDPSPPMPGMSFGPLTEQTLVYLRTEWENTSFLKRPMIRIFAGYSGWKEHQLEEEIAQKSWYWHIARPALVFHSPANEIWETVLAEKGPLFRILAESGTLPSLN